MRKTELQKKKIRQIVIIGVLAIGLLIGLLLVKQQQDLRKRAAGSNEVNLSLVPATGQKARGETFTAKIHLQKTATRQIAISGAQAVLAVPSQFTVTSASCLPPYDATAVVTQGAQSLTLFCAIGITAPTPAPMSTDLDFASVTFQVKADATLGNAPVTFTSTRVTESGIPGEAPDVSTAGQSASYTIATVATSTPTLTASPTSTPSPDPSGTPTSTPSQTPTPSITPTPSRTPTPTATPTPIPPTITLSPTPASGNEHYNYDIGLRPTLAINIGGGVDKNVPMVRFRTRLALTQGHPDMYMKLRVISEESLINGASYSCESAGSAGKDYSVWMHADGDGMYMPNVFDGDPPPPIPGTQIAHVSEDGWVSLSGLTLGDHYTFYLKGPKTRSTKEEKNIVLHAGPGSDQQFIWEGDGAALEAGDLPDPNNGGKQDCTVNVVDLSLIEANHAKTDQASLDIADVNYDGIVSGQDIAIVVNTLANRPDDD